MKLNNFMIIPFTNENFSSNSSKINITDNKIILLKGNYTLFLSFIVEKKNLGDMLTLYLSDEVVNEIELPTDEIEEHSINLKIPIVVNSDNSSLFLLNESDDTVSIKNLNGGIFMDVNLQIINILNFNPFSFDLELNTPFTSDMTISVIEIASDGTESKIPVDVLDKLNLSAGVDNDTIKTIIPATAPNVLFKVNTKYRVEVSTLTENASVVTSFDFSTFPMMNDKNCKTNPIGSRLLVIDFDYPVDNLDALNSYTTSNNIAKVSLNNFYISYFSSDPNVGETTNYWVGAIDTERTVSGQPTQYPFSIALSADSRRLEIQNNLGEFNTGDSNVSQPNRIAINRSKNQDTSKVLTDYSNRYIAPFELPFLSKRNTTPAKVVSVVAKSSYEVIVTFDAPVCSINKFLNPALFKLYKVVSGQADQSLNISKISRVGNDFNELLFVLAPPNTNILPFPEVTLKVGPVLDASGLITDTFTKTIPVPIIYPTVSLYSVNSDPDLGTTSIVLKYSELMDKTVDGLNSSINPLNYLLKNTTTGESIAINNVTSAGSSLTAVIASGLLPTANYSITAYDVIKSLSGNNLQTTVMPFNVVNTIIPTISKILASTDSSDNTNISSDDNSFVIIFNQAMNVQSNDLHSVLNQNNYKLRINTRSYILDENTIIEEIYKNKWIRYTLPVDPNNPIPDFIQLSDNYLIHAGYSTATDIKWITSADGAIYPLCDIKQIDYLLNKLNIFTGTASAISENTISYELNSDINKGTIVNNLFSSVSALDFQAEITRGGNTTTVKPLSAVLEPDSFTNVTLTFANGTFNIGDTVILKINPDDNIVRSLDIFGKPILSNTKTGIGEVNVTNKVPTSIDGISLLSITPASNGIYSNGLIELKFAMSISDTEPSDFDVYYIDSLGKRNHCNVRSAVTAASIGGDRPITIHLETELPYEVNSQILSNLYVSTVSDDALIPFRTYDIANNKVSKFENFHVSIFNATSLTWIYNPVVATGNDSYVFELGFSDDILTKYAIGTLATASNITVTPSGNSLLLDLMSSTTNFLNLGSIKLYFNNVSFTGDTYNWSASCQVSDTDSSKLLITITESSGSKNLFVDGKVNQTSDRGRAAYIVYTSSTVNSLIVNSSDTAQQFRSNKDSDKII